MLYKYVIRESFLPEKSDEFYKFLDLKDSAEWKRFWKTPRNSYTQEIRNYFWQSIIVKLCLNMKYFLSIPLYRYKNLVSDRYMFNYLVFTNLVYSKVEYKGNLRRLDPTLDFAERDVFGSAVQTMVESPLINLSLLLYKFCVRT